MQPVLKDCLDCLTGLVAAAIDHCGENVEHNVCELTGYYNCLESSFYLGFYIIAPSHDQRNRELP